MVSGSQACTDTEPFGRSKETFVRRFMQLDQDIPRHDAFSRLFRSLDPESLQWAPLRLVADRRSGPVRT